MHGIKGRDVWVETLNHYCSWLKKLSVIISQSGADDFICFNSNVKQLRDCVHNHEPCWIIRIYIANACAEGLLTAMSSVYEPYLINMLQITGSYHEIWNIAFCIRNHGKDHLLTNIRLALCKKSTWWVTSKMVLSLRAPWTHSCNKSLMLGSLNSSQWNSELHYKC